MDDAKPKPVNSRDSPSPSLLTRGYRFFFYLAILYPFLVAFLAIPAVQRHAAYQHSVRLPLFAKYDLPEKYGLAPGKTLNTNLTTSDNCTLGAWFALSDPYYQVLRSKSSGPLPAPTEDIVKDALQTYPTILYLHGAAGTRATSWRVGSLRSWTSRLQTNVFVIDYRGFADSTGSPDPAGLELDAYTAWQWLLERGAKPENIVVVGHSLGTGVTGQLMKRLAISGVAPRGVALLAPFSSLRTLIETYHVWGVPILQPLQTFPLGLKLLKRLIRHEFDTLSAIPEFNAPTLIAHSQDDMEIPHAHSKTLIDQLLEPLLPSRSVQLPSAPGARLTSEEFLAWTQEQEARSLKRGEIVKKIDIPNFGIVEEFKGLQVPVVYVESFWGSHAKIGLQEGVQDEMAKLFELGQYSGSEDSAAGMLVNRLVS